MSIALRGGGGGGENKKPGIFQTYCPSPRRQPYILLSCLVSFFSGLWYYRASASGITRVFDVSLKRAIPPLPSAPRPSARLGIARYGGWIRISIYARRPGRLTAPGPGYNASGIVSAKTFVRIYLSGNLSAYARGRARTSRGENFQVRPWPEDLFVQFRNSFAGWVVSSFICFACIGLNT